MYSRVSFKSWFVGFKLLHESSPLSHSHHALPAPPPELLCPPYPHNSNPRPASAAARLKQELAATSAAGAFDVDSSGSDATAE